MLFSASGYLYAAQQPNTSLIQTGGGNGPVKPGNQQAIIAWLGANSGRDNAL
jgi:hypothetical protein